MGNDQKRNAALARCNLWCHFTLAIGILLSGSTGCHTLDTPTVVKDGPYAAVVAGGVAESFDLPPGVDSNSAYAAGLRVGYRFMERRAAVELSYEQLGEFDFDLSDPPAEIGSFTGYTMTVQLKAYLNDAPLQFYGLTGVGILDAEVVDLAGIGLSDDGTDTIFKVGGGLVAHTGEHLSFFLEGVWTQPIDDLDEFTYTSILGGIGIRF